MKEQQNIVSPSDHGTYTKGQIPFGPPVREPFSFDEKVGFYRDLGFVGIQFHDDDIVPDIDEKTHAQLMAETKTVKAQLDDQGLTAEVVAPRLWESPETIDGAYTSNSRKEREYALERSKRCVDISNEIGVPKPCIVACPRRHLYPRNEIIVRRGGSDSGCY